MATIRPPGSDSAKSFIRRVGATIGILVVLAISFSACTTRVDAAHVGIRVKLAGSNRGVDDIPQVTGWVFYNPLTEQIIQFPISVQNVVWTKDPHEGSPRDESITFASLEGANINCDVGLAFQIDPKLAPHIAAMQARIAQALDLAPGQVNVKAKTAEKLGPVGQGLSIEARAVALLVKAGP